MSLRSRLREIVRSGPPGGGARDTSAGPYGGPPEGGLRDKGAHDPADILGGEWREAHGQACLVIERKYSPGYRHGRVAIADALPPAGGWPSLEMLGSAGSNLLFLDLETTGLAGGAGTYAFLVGCAWFEPFSHESSASQPVCFRVRQLLLTSHTAERALLEMVDELARRASTLVTYNGKTFDVPLMDTRYALHRRPTPFADLAHLDMLHPARRLWRGSTDDGAAPSGRLMAVEQGLLGHHRDGDVPGFEIPSRYFHYVRTGDPRPLDAVLEHNRLDLLALALMTARAAQLLEEGATAAATGREALGLGRLYERAGQSARAQACFARAAALAADPATTAEALRALALNHRRARQYDEAANAWRRLLEVPRCPPHMAREAIEALAIHHEHRVRDLERAHAFASQLMDTRRLERLKRKISRLRIPDSPGLPGLSGIAGALRQRRAGRADVTAG